MPRADAGPPAKAQVIVGAGYVTFHRSGQFEMKLPAGEVAVLALPGL